MSTLPTNEVSALLYGQIIFPWETDLKSRVGCWDVHRTRKQLAETTIDLRCVMIGDVESALKERTPRSSKDFVYFVSSTSQMQDLFRHLRNCAAHASIHQVSSGSRNGPLLQFHGKLNRRHELAIAGTLHLKVLSLLLRAIVTHP